MPTTKTQAPEEYSKWIYADEFLSQTKPSKDQYKKEALTQTILNKSLVERSWNFANSYLGQMKLYYDLKVENLLNSNCLNKCYTGISPSNITQQEKSCLINCNKEKQFLREGMETYFVNKRYSDMKNDNVQISDYKGF